MAECASVETQSPFSIIRRKKPASAWRATGCNAVEMWPPHLEGCRTPLLLRQFRDFAAELGLELWGLNAVGADYFQPFGAQENYDRTLAGLKADVDYALELGVEDVMVWEGTRPPIATRPMLTCSPCWSACSPKRSTMRGRKASASLPSLTPSPWAWITP